MSKECFVVTKKKLTPARFKAVKGELEEKIFEAQDMGFKHLMCELSAQNTRLAEYLLGLRETLALSVEVVVPREECVTKHDKKFYRLMAICNSIKFLESGEGSGFLSSGVSPFAPDGYVIEV